MTPQDTMRMALDWLDNNGGAHIADELRSALAQQGEQQPVASLYIGKDGDREVDDWRCELPAGRYELYAGAAQAAQQGEPVAIRYDFDGYGWQYIDSGSGSNWREKVTHLDAEPLYAGAAPQPEAVPLAEYQKLQALVTSQGIRLMEYESAPAAKPTEREALLMKEMRHIAGISTGQVQRVANQALENVKDAPAVQPLSDEQIDALRIILEARKVSVAMVQRKMNIGYNKAQTIVQSLLDAGWSLAQFPKAGIGVQK